MRTLKRAFFFNSRKNIEFVSMSIDRMTDHDKWVAMVNDKELGGTQIMADKDWKSDFVQGYAIEGIPRFILIDPNGNIVSADAPRPSNPKLKELRIKPVPAADPGRSHRGPGSSKIIRKRWLYKHPVPFWGGLLGVTSTSKGQLPGLEGRPMHARDRGDPKMC